MISGRALLIAIGVAAGRAWAEPAAEDAGVTPTRRIALAHLDVRGDADPALAAMLESALCAELPAASGWESVCPDDVQVVAALALTSATFGTCASDDCIRQVRDATRASRRVTGELSRVGEATILTLTLWDGNATPADGIVNRPLRRVAEVLPAEPAAALSRVAEVARKLFR